MNNIIYGLIDPNTKELRYIGKTNNLKIRLYKHHYIPNLITKTHRNHWIKSLLSVGQIAEAIVIETYNTYEELDDAEKEIISYFKFIGCNLTNATDGGEGTTGHKHSDESKKKMSLARKGKIQSQETINKRVVAITGLSRTEKTKQQMSKSASIAQIGNTNCLGRILSDETKIKISNGNKGKVISEETRLKLKGKTPWNKGKKEPGKTWKLVNGKRVYSKVSE